MLNDTILFNLSIWRNGTSDSVFFSSLFCVVCLSAILYLSLYRIKSKSIKNLALKNAHWRSQDFNIVFFLGVMHKCTYCMFKNKSYRKDFLFWFHAQRTEEKEKKKKKKLKQESINETLKLKWKTTFWVIDIQLLK